MKIKYDETISWDRAKKLLLGNEQLYYVQRDKIDIGYLCYVCTAPVLAIIPSEEDGWELQLDAYHIYESELDNEVILYLSREKSEEELERICDEVTLNSNGALMGLIKDSNTVVIANE